jgi:phage tail sheath protein FI
MYFPRVLAHDKLRGHFECFAPCGAVAGMLARCDELSPVWLPSEREEPILRPGIRPACLVGEDRRMRLASLGVNTVQAIRSTGRLGLRGRTLAAGNTANADWRYLSARRLALFILNCIECGTRWIAAARSPADVADALISQVRAFLEGLCEAGAFGPRRADDAYFVICDQRVNASWSQGSGEVHFVIGFAASREHEFHCFRISQSAAGGKIQPVSLNRLNFSQYSPAELEWVDKMADRLQS